MEHDVFISYSDEDILTAEAVCAGLESRGLRCWYAARDIVRGENPARARERAIAESSLLVLIFSDYSNDSQLILREVCSAADGRKPIVPFRVSRQQPVDSLRYFLGGTHWLDAVDGDSRKAINKLADECVNKLRHSPEKGRKRWILPAVIILAVVVAAAGILAFRGGKPDTAEETQEEQTEEPEFKESPYDNMTFTAGDMTCGEFRETYETKLESSGYRSEPFRLELFDESGAPGAEDSKVGSIRLTLDQDSAAGVDEAEIEAHILAVVSTAFSGDDGDDEVLADRLMNTYGTSEMAVNNVLDGMMLFANFKEKGGRLTIEPL